MVELAHLQPERNGALFGVPGLLRSQVLDTADIVGDPVCNNVDILTVTRKQQPLESQEMARTKAESRLVRFIRTHRSGLIAGALVAEVIISPAADYHPHFGAVLAALILLVIVTAASYLARHRFVHLVVMPVAGLWALARLFEAFGNPHHLYSQLAPLAGLTLSCTLLWGIVERGHRVLRAPRTALAEAFIAYLLIAIAFAQLYWILNQAVQKPFNQVIPPYEISTLVYFSMVTISSVGYGGIAPVNPYVRMVAAFEGITGIFYIAVVVARLVASYRSSNAKLEE